MSRQVPTSAAILESHPKFGGSVKLAHTRVRPARRSHPVANADRLSAERNPDATLGGCRLGRGRAAATGRQTGARMVPLSNAAMSVLSALPRPEDNPWVTSPPRTAVRISPVSRSLGAASAPWPGSTTFESMTIATPLHPGPWLWAEAFR